MVLRAWIRIIHAACIDDAFSNPSWFALNIFMRWMLSLVPSFANILGALILSWASEFDHVCLMKLQPKLLFIVGIFISFTLFSSRCSSPLLRGFSPASRIEHIQKYSSIEKFMKLPFQQVVGHQNRSSNEGVMPISFQHCVLSRTVFWTFDVGRFGHYRS